MLESILDLVRQRVEDARAVSPDTSFAASGLSSMGAVEVCRELGRESFPALTVAAFFAHPTPRALARALEAGDLGGDDLRLSATGPSSEPIAVVGMSLRLPGAEGPGEFWDLLNSSRNVLGPAPEGRFPSGSVPGVAGYLDQPLDQWDHQHFGLTQREVEDIDPVQALFLEVAWECLSSARWTNGFAGTDTGVFVGSIWSERTATSRRRTSPFTATGSSLSMVANRASYLFDLKGPSVTLDSACSSSLVAVHMAVNSLRLGECRTAVAGGVNLLQSMNTMNDLLAFGGLSADGTSKAFQAGADGFGRGEGAVALLLKRWSDALIDGNEVLALVRGTAINNDGRSNGLTAPNPLAQERVIRAAHHAGGTSPAKVAYVETHGTGTALGDPIEASAIAAALGTSRDRESPVILGAVKEVIGHLEGAAGVAGLAKAVLACTKGLVPPGRFAHGPTDRIDFTNLGLDLSRKAATLDTDDLVGVSSFGWGGTNGHVVLGPGPSLSAHTMETSHSGGIALLFSPYGGQWVGAGRDLLSDPVFRRSLERTDEGAAPVLGCSILDVIARAEQHADAGPGIWQPTIHAIQVGLWEVLRAHGVVPSVMVGHSLGEIAAAVACGALSAGEGGRVVAHYAAAQQKLVGHGGGMAVVEITEEGLSELLTSEPTLTVAGHNSAWSFNLSGPSPHLEHVVERARATGHRAAIIDVGLAAHSPEIDGIAGDLLEALGELRVATPRTPMVSTVTGEPLEAGQLGAEYFVTGLRSKVLLAEALGHSLVQSCADVIEVNARPILADPASQVCQGQAIHHVYGVDGLHLPWDAPADERLGLITASATSEAGLTKRIQQLTDASRTEDGRDTAVTTSRAPRLRQTAFVVTRDQQPAADDWRRRVVRETSPEGVILVFPGQGGQWLGMGRSSFAQSRVFEEEVRRCDHALRTEAGVSVIDWFLEPGDDVPDDTRVDLVQPALFTFQVAMARALMDAGVRVSGVVGHSMGEVAAAHVAGHLSLTDAARVIGRRSRVMNRLAGIGGMLATDLTEFEAQDIVEQFDGLAIAALNAPSSTVLAGPSDVIESAALVLTERGFFNRGVKVSVASHSAVMDPILDDLLDELRDVDRTVGSIPWFSSVWARLVSDDDQIDATYWAHNLRKPVRFVDAVRHAMGAGDVVVEVSPHPVLAPAVRDIAVAEALDVEVLSPFVRGGDGHADLLELAGELWAHGLTIDVTRLQQPGRALLAESSYAFHRTARSRPTEVRAAMDDGIPGIRIPVPGVDDQVVWLGRLSSSTAQCHDHVLHGRPVVPAALVIDALTATQGEVWPLSVRELALHSPIEPTDVGVDVRIGEDRREPGIAKMTLTVAADPEAAATAVLVAHSEKPRALAAVPELTSVTNDVVHDALRRRGLDFGPAYQRVTQLEVAPGFARAMVPLRQGESALTPAILDAVLQVGVTPFLMDLDEATTPVSVAFEAVWLRGPSDCGSFEVTAASREVADGFLVDIDGLSADGEPVMMVRGMRVALIPNLAAQSAELPRDLVAAPTTSEGILHVVRQAVAGVCGATEASIDPDVPFRDLGISSVLGLELKSRLEQTLKHPLRATIVWNFPTVNALAVRLAEIMVAQDRDPEPAAPRRTSTSRPPQVLGSQDLAPSEGRTAVALLDEMADLESLLEDL